MKELFALWFSHVHAWLDTIVPESASPWLLLAAVLTAGYAVDYLLRFLLLHVVRRLVLHTRARWDDMLFDEKVLRRFCNLIPPMLFTAALPAIFAPDPVLRMVLALLHVTIVIMFVRLVNAILAAVFSLMSSLPAWHGKPLKGLLQTSQIVISILGGIAVVSFLAGTSPGVLLTGLGASAAIMMLIFKDAILGFVSGVQLSANNMLKVGDWITLPKYDADGEVEEVNLTTVKVRNFDNTITTIPPYLLTNDSFQNWEGMRASGGRRVKRAIYIDMNSIRFATPEMLEKYAHNCLVHDYISRTQSQIDEYNLALGVSGAAAGARNQTNVGVFRNYLQLYLSELPGIRHDMTLLVRQLQPTATGLPLELYFFTDTVDWLPYERIQSDVFDHVFSILPEFDLRVYQAPTGEDFQALKGHDRA